MSGILNMLLAAGPPGIINDSLPNGAINDTRCSFRINSDGTYSITGGGSGNWIEPTGAASLYEVKVDVVSGTFDSAESTGTWLACTSDRHWYVDDPGGFGIKTVVFDISFRPAGGATQSTQEDVQIQSVDTDGV